MKWGGYGEQTQTAARAPPSIRCGLVDGRSERLEADRNGARSGDRTTPRSGYSRADAGVGTEGDGPPALSHRNKKMS